MYKVQGVAGCSGLRVVKFRDDFRIYGSASTQKNGISKCDDFCYCLPALQVLEREGTDVPVF